MLGSIMQRWWWCCWFRWKFQEALVATQKKSQVGRFMYLGRSGWPRSCELCICITLPLRKRTFVCGTDIPNTPNTVMTKKSRCEDTIFHFPSATPVLDNWRNVRKTNSPNLFQSFPPPNLVPVFLPMTVHTCVQPRGIMLVAPTRIHFSHSLH